MSTIYIIYGSETGNARLLAESAVSQLKSQGLHSACAGMEDITPEVIGAMRLLLIITSTWGDGDPPSNASELHYQLSKTERRCGESCKGCDDCDGCGGGEEHGGSERCDKGSRE